MRRFVAVLAALLVSAAPLPAQRNAGRGSSAPASAPRSSGTHYSSGGRSAPAPSRNYASPRNYARVGGQARGISPARYAARFGPAHPFRPWHGVRPGPWGHGWGHGWGHPWFWYGGLYWGFAFWPYEVGPYFWGYDDPIYIVVEDGNYYACDTLHPDQKVGVAPGQGEGTGWVRIEDKASGDPVYIDGGLAGRAGDLKEFRLPAGPHTIEVKGKRYLGEDVTVVADHVLVVEVPD